jgi:regulator of protease activity HflC (stomatin/prohibitin superfamily)
MGLYGFDIVVVVLVGLVILTIALGVRTIPQGYNYAIERFGRYSHTLGAGLSLIIPYIERVGHKINTSRALLFRRLCPTMPPAPCLLNG